MELELFQSWYAMRALLAFALVALLLAAAIVFTVVREVFPIAHSRQAAKGMLERARIHLSGAYHA